MFVLSITSYDAQDSEFPMNTDVSRYMSEDKSRLTQIFVDKCENKLGCSGLYSSEYGEHTETNGYYIYVANYTEVEEV